MTDEEKNEKVEEATAEDSDAEAAGPVAESGGSAGGGEASVLDPPDSTPPADEASEEQPQDDDAPDESSDEPEVEQDEPEAAKEAAPAEEEAAAEAEPAADSSPEDDLPWKEKRRLERSRLPHLPRPQQTPEERKVARAEGRKRKAALRRTQREAAKGEKSGGAGTPPAEPTPNAAKVRQGIVVSDKGEKSITVRIDIARRHPTYEKIVRRSRTLHAHDERNEAGEGDVVRVIETRPLSKTKRWRLVEIMEKAK
jgi:small subunit ribosomal protein S17